MLVDDAGRVRAFEDGAWFDIELPRTDGSGHHGAHDGRTLFNDQDALTLTITVVPDERAPALIAGLRELLERRPGVMFVSQVSVSRPHYFQ